MRIFATLLNAHGEELTVTRGSGENAETFTLQGLVRRPQAEGQDPEADKRSVNFTLREQSVIQLAHDAITPGLAVGESLLDEFGRSHRVQKILPAPGFLKLVCKPS